MGVNHPNIFFPGPSLHSADIYEIIFILNFVCAVSGGGGVVQYTEYKIKFPNSGNLVPRPPPDFISHPKFSPQLQDKSGSILETR